MKKFIPPLLLSASLFAFGHAEAQTPQCSGAAIPGMIIGANVAATSCAYGKVLDDGSVLVTTEGSSSSPSFIKPAPLTIIPLDVATVTTGGTAVTALIAGHKAAGGFLFNPMNATINLCINEQGTASGTTSSNATTCIAPGAVYNLTPSTGAVSVISSDSSHPFSGYGLN